VLIAAEITAYQSETADNIQWLQQQPRQVSAEMTM